MSRLLRAGERVGHWILERQLGVGGYGATWQATSAQGGRAAIKVLPGPPGEEIRALSRICHPAVVGVLGAGMHPVPYLALEVAPGQPLSRLLRSGAPPVQVATRMVATLAHALASVHRAGVVHGDIKPENIVVASPRLGQACLVDFGAGRRGGGTLAYAAPELTRGEAATEASDVYALGIVFFELLEGELPWASLELASALMKRRSSVPSTERGELWMRELLSGMLALRPDQRPSAEDVADAFASHGVEMPRISSELLRRRASRAHVHSATVEDTVQRWLGDGGSLCFTGPGGSGRTHELERLVVEVQARGWTVLRLPCHAAPWASVESALVDPALPGEPHALPEGDSDERRAMLAMAALLDRLVGVLTVVVDDLEHLDVGGRALLEALRGSGRVRMVLAAHHAPEHVDHTVALAPFTDAQLHELLLKTLGQVADLDAVVEIVASGSGGLPGLAIDIVTDAVREGVLARPRTSWVCDLDRLRGLRVAATLSRARALSDNAKVLGSLLAVRARPMSLASLRTLELGALEELRAAMDELVWTGFAVRDGRMVRVAGQRARDALVELSPNPARVHRTLLLRLLRQEPVPLLACSHHLLGADDRELALEHAEAVVRALLRVDPVGAADLASGLLERWLDPVLVGLSIESMVAAGRVEDALALGRAAFANREPVPEDLPALVALAELHLHHLGDLDTAWSYIHLSEALDWPEGLPLTVIITKANAYFRAGAHADAVRAAQTVADGPPPQDLDALDSWLNLRLIWAQAIHASGRTREAIAILDSVPRGIGVGRASRAMVEASRGRLLWHAGRMSEAAEALTLASHSDAGLPVLERARLLNNAALAHYQTGDLNGALASWETALVLAERLGTQLEQIQIRNNLCIGFREAMRWERARQAGSWAERQAAEQALPIYQAMAAGNLGELELIRGNFQEAQAHFARCRRVAEAHELMSELAELARREAELAVETSAQDALELCGVAVQASVAADSRLEEARARALLAVCRVEQGELEAAEEQLSLAEASLEGLGAGRELAEVHLWAAEAWSRGGDGERARTLLGEVLTYAHANGHALLRHRAQRRIDALDAGRSRPISDSRILQLLGVSAQLLTSEDTERVLEAIADAALLFLDMGRAFVFLGPKAERLAVERGREGLSDEGPSRSIIERCLELRREVISVDLGDRPDLREHVSVAALGLRSVLCVPLLHDDEALGVIYLDSRDTVDRRMEAAVDLMKGLAQSAAAALVTTRRITRIRRVAEEAAELVHDLRGPALSLRDIAHARAQTTRDDHARDDWEAVSDISDRMVTLTTQFMQPIRVDSGRVDLVKLSWKLLRMHRSRAREHAVRLVFEGVKAAEVDARRLELERAFSNLIENALKYSPRGAAVTVRVGGSAGGWVWSVRDSGPGIEPEAQATIFKRGVQGPGALPGRGLGLAIAHRNVESEGGRLTVGNHPEGGAIFEVWLPRVEEAE